MRSRGMEGYWDGRAREDAYRYVDTTRWFWQEDLDAFWRTGEEIIDRLFTDLDVDLTGDEDVVEIGCGVGRLTRVLSGRARSVQAFDISAEMLAQARRHNSELSNVRWLHGNGSTLAPLPDRSADACVSFVVFQHLPDAELTYSYVREMGRVLRPGGWAVFQLSNDPLGHGRPRLLRRLEQAFRAGHYHHPAWWGSAVEIPRLREAAANGHLEIERVENEGSKFCLVLARRGP